MKNSAFSEAFNCSQVVIMYLFLRGVNHHRGKCGYNIINAVAVLFFFFFVAFVSIVCVVLLNRISFPKTMRLATVNRNKENTKQENRK